MARGKTKKVDLKEAPIEVKEIKPEIKIQTSFTKIYLIPALVIIFLVLFAIFIPKRNANEIIEVRNLYEITEKDIIMEKISAGLVSVKGVKLGDTLDRVKEKLGNADFQRSYPPNVLNWEYASSIDTLGTGILLHFENGILTRITLAEPFNKYLIDKTKIGSTTEDLYKNLGKPTDIKFITKGDSMQSGKAFKKIIFGNFGYEFVMDKDLVKFFSLILPDQIKNKGLVKI